jgi:pyruvate dehydrogenase E2 component (dihydrolipoamide acetyltransferase)
MTQGNVGAWQKKIGDQLSPGEVLVEIETDKAQMDFEFQEDGYLAKILVEEGAKDVPVGKPIGVYVEDAADVSAFADFTAADASNAPATPTEEAAPAASAASAASEAPAAPAAESTPAPASASSEAPYESRIKASPIAKLIALEQGIPLKDIKGTGPDGRIIKRDVENYKPPVAAAAPAASATPAAPAPTKAAPAPVAAGGEYEDVPISQMRKTIASRLQASKVNAPHYVVSSTVSVSKLLKLRASLNASSDGSYKISVNDLLIKAIGIANSKVPQVNTSWLEAEGVLRQYKDVDVSVAVATPTGLITPVVKAVNKKGLASISNEIKALGKRAREGKLFPEEYQGGTVTISNLGMNPAVSFFTAIINPPQSAILAVGTTERRAIEDPESESGIAFDDVISVTASFDHRVVDGAIGGEWIKALKKVIENPLEMLL